MENGGGKLRRIFRGFASTAAAACMTALLFLILPVMQTIGKPPPRDLTITQVGIAEPPPPPPPVVEEEPPPEETQEAPPPDLRPEVAPLDLSQIELALNPGIGGAGAGIFSDLSDRLAGKIDQAGAGDDLDRVFALADLDQKPRVIFQTPPRYPPDLRRRGFAGSVTILFTVDVNGRVVDPKVEKSTDPAFESPAVDAVKQWRFEPGTRKGEKVQFRMRIPITFDAA